MKNLLIICSIMLLQACADSAQMARDDQNAPVLSASTTQSDAFNQSFKKMLNAYYKLKDQFISEDENTIQSSAKYLLTTLDSLLIDDFKADTIVRSTAQSYLGGITAEIIGLLGEKDLGSKRKSFQMVSEQLYDLIRTVHYDQEVVYHQYCPMAFDNEGATWLSNSSFIVNPYIPKKMLNCGEIRDSIDFRRK